MPCRQADADMILSKQLQSVTKPIKHLYSLQTILLKHHHSAVWVVSWMLLFVWALLSLSLTVTMSLYMDWVSPGRSHLSPLPETFLTPGFLRLAFYSPAFTPMLIMRKKINDKPACHKWFENLEHTTITIFQRMEHNNMCLRIFPSSQFSLYASFHARLA